MKNIMGLKYLGAAMLAAGMFLANAPSVLASDVAEADGARATDKLLIAKSVYKIQVPEIRAMRKNDTLSVQADFVNDTIRDKHVYYRFRWLDSVGNQVGDGEAWKQLLLLGRGRETVKGVALSPSAVDFRIELNVQSKAK
jgi:uncharacterized protein YcfL